MSDPIWTKNIKILLQYPKEFWPSKYMSYNEKMNSITRFIIYFCLILTLLKNNPSYLILLFVLLFVLTKIIKSPLTKQTQALTAKHTQPDKYNGVEQNCTLSTKENPFSNVLVSDYTQNPSRSSACDSSSVSDDINKNFFSDFQQDPYDIYNKKHSQRQFYSTPNSRIPNDQSSFAHWLYGNCNKTCKEVPQNCTGTEAFG